MRSNNAAINWSMCDRDCASIEINGPILHTIIIQIRQKWKYFCYRTRNRINWLFFTPDIEFTPGRLVMIFCTWSPWCKDNFGHPFRNFIESERFPDTGQAVNLKYLFLSVRRGRVWFDRGSCKRSFLIERKAERSISIPKIIGYQGLDFHTEAISIALHLSFFIFERHCELEEMEEAGKLGWNPSWKWMHLFLRLLGLLSRNNMFLVGGFGVRQRDLSEDILKLPRSVGILSCIASTLCSTVESKRVDLRTYSEDLQHVLLKRG